MRKILPGVSLVGLIGLAVGLGGAANAQVPAPGGTVAPAVAAGASPLALSVSYLVDMEAGRGRLQSELQRARQERDVVRILCLDDKLRQLDVALQSGAEHRRTLELGVQRGDPAVANGELAILSVFHQRAQELDTEAMQCIGKEVAYVGESTVSMSIQRALPSEDPTDYAPLGSTPQPPSCRSCNR